MLGAPVVCGTFNNPRLTASANTVFRSLIRPFMGSSYPPKLFQVDPTSTSTGAPKNNFTTDSDAWTHVTDLWYTSLTTAHSLYLLRPLNYTWSTSAVPANTTTSLTVAFNPGAWDTAGIYKYGSATGGVPNYATNAAAANDILAYQLNDGTWQIDTIASTTSATVWVLGTGTPNVTGAGINAYTPIYWFGAVGDTDPATGQIQPLFDSIANTNVTFRSNSAGFGMWNALHRGDPLIFQSSNGTDAGLLEVLAGYYSTKF